jgi:hypothetical protein
LAIYVGQAGELTEGPEVLADIADAAALHFTLFPTRRWIAGPRIEVQVASETEESRMKPHQTAILFGNGRLEVLCAAIRYVE